MTNGDDEMGVDVAQVVADVKEAILEANLYQGGATDLVVNGVSLHLAVVVDTNIGIDGTFKVPFINKDLGAAATRGWSSANSIEVDLVPPRAGTAQALGKPDIKSELAQAISVVRSTVQAARARPPKFDLDSAEVVLTFGVSTDGSIKLVASGARHKETTQQLTLKLGPPPSGGSPASPKPSDRKANDAAG